MKHLIRLFAAFFVIAFLFGSSRAVEARSYRTKSSDAYVKGYTRKDGTYVSPHYRSAPDGIVSNNYSCIDDGRCGSSNYTYTPSPSYSYTPTPTIQPTPTVPSYYSYYPTVTQAQPTCPTNAWWNGTKCSCFMGYVPAQDGLSCVSQDAACKELNGQNAYFNSTSNQCYCEMGYLFDKASGKCMEGGKYCQKQYSALYIAEKKDCYCGAGSEFNSTTGQCATKIPSVVVPVASFDAQNPCPANASVSQKTGWCECKRGYRWNAEKTLCN